MASNTSPNLNFCYPIDTSKLQNERLSLVPFDSNLALFSRLYQTCTSQPLAQKNFKYLPYGPFASATAFTHWYTTNMQPERGTCWFAILVTKSGMEKKSMMGREGEREEEEEEVGEDADDGTGAAGTFAGSIALLNCDEKMAVGEIGHINILPSFQRTFVASHANGLLLHYLLDPIRSGCLGLRRVTWFANASNQRSVEAAKRLGFTFEGVLRWHRMLPEGKEGEDAGDGRGPGRHSAVLGLCWDDWTEGGRDVVTGLMRR